MNNDNINKQNNKSGLTHLVIGNPNVGKSTMFNLLTSSHAHVGNWSGVTVEREIGKLTFEDNTKAVLIDLPGVYSTIPSSEDEGVVSKSLLNEQYDGIINVVDGTHLKRNLHLTLQLLESNAPFYLAINMADELMNNGLTIDTVKLANKLGVDVSLISSKRKEGIEDFKKSIREVKQRDGLKIFYGVEVENAISNIEHYIQSKNYGISARFLAIQLLEGNKEMMDVLSDKDKEFVQGVLEKTECEIVDKKIALSLKGAIFLKRREFISEVVESCVYKDKNYKHERKFINGVDKVLTHPILGMAVFLVVMYLIYFITFDWLGAFLSDTLDGFIGGTFTDWTADFLTFIYAPGWIESLLLDGIIAGVGGVLVFVPQIFLLFVFLAFIEGTGYMARVSILFDTILSKFDLNGKAIIPMITGIGCTVPAIMATRTIVDKKERMMTILVLPFISCSARLPIYGLFVSIFFESSRALIIMLLYVVSVLITLLAAKFLSLTIFKGHHTDFILEVPPYRIPDFVHVLGQAWNKSKNFITKAGTYILVGTVLIWVLSYFGTDGGKLAVDVDINNSFLAHISGFFAPLLSPIGLGTWQAFSSLVTGFFAKEAVASSMLVVYGTEAAILASYTTAAALSFLFFTLLYVPCLATVGVIKQETKSYKMVGLSIGMSLVIAYVLAFIVYQVAVLLT